MWSPGRLELMWYVSLGVLGNRGNVVLGKDNHVCVAHVMVGKAEGAICKWDATARGVYDAASLATGGRVVRISPCI